MSLLTAEDLAAAARARVDKALRHIECAQDELSRACGELSALNGGIPVWNACHKLTDRVHAFWYRVDGFRQLAKYSLDRTNVAALEDRIRKSLEVRS